MICRSMLAVFLLAILAIPARPQDSIRGSISRPRSVELRIRVTLSNDHPLTTPVRVQIMISGAPANETFTDDRGEAVFYVPGGIYRVKISGQDIEETTTDSFQIDSLMGVHVEFVRVPLKADAQLRLSTESSIAIVDINVPRKAQKEFNKGVENLAKNKLSEAKARFEAAIALYPQYATAYNYLGVAEIRNGQTAPAQAAFQQATKLNDKYADALLNLGKIMYQQQKYAEAEDALGRVISLDPQNTLVLTLLAQTQLVNGKLDLALANARRAHATNLPHMASTHLIAARVLESRRDMPSAMVEYKLYVKEAPNTPAATQIKAGLDRYEKAPLQKPEIVPGKKLAGKETAPDVAAPSTTEKPNF